MAEKVAKMPSPAPETQSEPLQDPKPLLQGALISYTGFTIQEREEINIKIREMGGQVSVALTDDITHLIAKKVAFEQRIPVLAPEWLDTIYLVWKKGEHVDLKKATEDFTMGPLKGCSICVTGLSGEQRQNVHRETIRHGGKYTNDLLRGLTTHLICDQPSGNKYISALEWGIKCVSRQWFRDTLTSLELADEKNYSMTAYDRREYINGKDMAGQQKELEQGDNLDDEALLVVPQSMYLELCQIYLCPSFPSSLTALFKKLIRMAGGIHITDYDPQCVTHVLVPSDRLDPAIVAIFENETSVTPYIVNQQWLRSSNREGKALPEADFIVPFPTRTEDGQLKPVRFTGATTWSTDKTVKSRETNEATKSNFATLRNQSKALTTNDDLPDTASWKSNPADHAELMAYRNKSEESPATTPKARKVSESPSKLSPHQIRNGLRARTVSGILSDALDDLSVNGFTQNYLSAPTVVGTGTQLEEEDETQVSNIFLGLHITSHGCKGAKMIREQTIACGGTYFEETETPPAEAPVKTIVPLSMVRKTQDIGELNSNEGSRGTVLPFKGFLLSEELGDGDKSQVRNNPSRTPSATSHRSDDSQRSNSSATINSMGSMEQPVPSDTPLEGLVICIPSRVTGDYREMQGLVTDMGARLLTSYDSSASHFVHKGKATLDAKRDLRAAKRDSIFTVSPEWLYKCMENRIRVDERDYPETYDGKHLTLNTTTTTLRTPQERPALAVLPKRSSSPSLRPSGRSSGKKKVRSASVGFQPHRPGAGLSSPSQAFQGTAAGVMSAMFSGDSVSSSINMSSADNSMDMSLTDMHSMEQDGGSHSDSLAIWQPIPLFPVTRSASSRKRRRAVPVTEEGSLPTADLDTSVICETPDTTSDGVSIPENYFDKSAERYGEDAVYWEDTESREKKRAFLESLGYKTFKPSPASNGGIDSRLEALARDLESQRCPRFYFLLTGITVVDRRSFQKTIQQLGGVVLEEKNDDHDEWKEKCTHLVTNGNNPPRTAKLVIAKACQAMIVNKGFIIASGENGSFVDETPYR
ncbi:DNA topoisomerase 2-binding protein 1, partial [Mortierella sp. AM989]